MEIKELLQEDNLKTIYGHLDDLCSRLQLDYSGDSPFKQQEEDRLVVYNICDILEYILKGGKIKC